MRKDEAGHADVVGVFRSGARTGDYICPTREGSFPLGLLEKDDDVANLVDSSLIGKRI